MRFNFGECGESVRQKKIVLTEKRRKFVGLNAGQKEILKVMVDNCLSIQGRRCDWLLIDLAGNTGHFIELKGCDLEHAFSQLKNTITIISNTHNGFIRQEFKAKKAYVVVSRCPINTTEIQIAKARFRRRLNVVLDVKNRWIEQKL